MRPELCVALGKTLHSVINGDIKYGNSSGPRTVIAISFKNRNCFMTLNVVFKLNLKEKCQLNYPC